MATSTRIAAAIAATAAIAIHPIATLQRKLRVLHAPTIALLPTLPLHAVALAEDSAEAATLAVVAVVAAVALVAEDRRI